VDVLELTFLLRANSKPSLASEAMGIRLEAPLRKSLERAIEYIDSDEYVDATPTSLRLRKHILGATTRKRAADLNYTICV
jgi:GTP-binding protein